MEMKFAFLVVSLICATVQTLAQSDCQKCLPSNEAYCLNETSYYLCLDGRNPSLGTISKCPSGQVCTASANICEPKGSKTPACGGSTCGECPTSSDRNRYTCVSRTQFGRCSENKVTYTGDCGEGHICSSELYAKTGTICAPQCVTDFYDYSPSCDSDVPVTTTTAAAPTINIEDIRKQCRDAEPYFSDKKVFYIPNSNDSDCKTYIFCEKIGNDIDGLLVKCANDNFFDPPSESCKAVRPADCILRTTTTQATISQSI